MKIWQKTDQGAVRKENQDICAAEQLDQYTLAVVCDGMGGARAGALASSLAAGAFLEALRGTLRPGTGYHRCGAGRRSCRSKSEPYCL